MTKDSKENTPNALSAVITLAIAGGFIWFAFGGGLDKFANKELQRIENKVAADAVNQYNIAKRNGNAMDVCVQVGLVTASYLQANDESNYAHWKNIQTHDCAKAGIRH